VHRRDHTVEALTPPHLRGPALGIFPKAAYQCGTHVLKAQDFIMLFTDGLFEVENLKAELFSEERLRAVVEMHSELPPEPMVQAVFHDVEAFTGGAPFPDDLCVVGVHIARLQNTAA
jgi:sigma-B regulation protein RsbU (phosphoserine phosphatase)